MKMRGIIAVTKSYQAVLKIKPEKCRPEQDLNPLTPAF